MTTSENTSRGTPAEPENMDFNPILSPEQQEALNTALKTAVEAITKVVQELTKWFSEVISNIVKALSPILNNIFDYCLYIANSHPRWWYLYKHSKKWRVRKKYRKLLIQQFNERTVKA